MGNLGPTEIILLLLVALLLFGAKRLPEVGRSLGTGMREFKDSVTGSGSGEPAEMVQLPDTSDSFSRGRALREKEH